jgi:hypothetical protein
MLYLAGQLLKWACLLASINDHTLSLRSASLLVIDNRINLEVYDMKPFLKAKLGNDLMLIVGESDMVDITGKHCGEDISECLKRESAKKDFRIDLKTIDTHGRYTSSLGLLRALTIINASAPANAKVTVCVYLSGYMGPGRKLEPDEIISEALKMRERQKAKD